MEKAMILVIKKWVLQIWKFVYLLLVIFSYLGVTVHFLILVSNNTITEPYLIAGCVVAFIHSIWVLSSIVGSGEWLKNKRLIFLISYSVLPFAVLLYGLVSYLIDPKSVNMLTVFLYSLFYIPSILFGWTYSKSINYYNQKLSLISSQIKEVEPPKQ